MERTVRLSNAEISCVFSYLLAIVAANMVIASYGQQALPLTAFVLIPFDLVTRDILHERWSGRNLWLKMTALILSGSLLSAFMAPAVAFASATAFAAAGGTNAFVYALMDGRSRFSRMNTSNLFAAVVDSIVFPAIAFSTISVPLVIAQASSKFIGGVFFTSLVLHWSNKRRKRNADHTTI